MVFLVGGSRSTASAQVTSIGVTTQNDLHFGQIVTGTTSGTVTVSPSGTRTASGGSTLASGASVSAASFQVTGDPDVTFAITLPSSASLSSGADQMTVDGFVSDPDQAGSLDATGAALFRVGATLQLRGGQSSGAYSGQFDVRVDYN